MKKVMMLSLYLLLAAACYGQSVAKWQVATIMDVKSHLATAGEDPSVVRYDVTLRVGNIEYVVLYVPPEGTVKDMVRYLLGQDGLVLVGADTITYNDTLGRPRKLSILSSSQVKEKKTAENKPGNK